MLFIFFALLKREQTPPELDRIVSINKELAQLSPVVDAFTGLRHLEQARRRSLYVFLLT